MIVSLLGTMGAHTRQMLADWGFAARLFIKLLGMSGVAQDTEPRQAYFGTPARPAREMHKMHAALAKLPELLVKVRELETRLLAANS